MRTESLLALITAFSVSVVHAESQAWFYANQKCDGNFSPQPHDFTNQECFVGELDGSVWVEDGGNNPDEPDYVCLYLSDKDNCDIGFGYTLQLNKNYCSNIPHVDGHTKWGAYKLIQGRCPPFTLSVKSDCRIPLDGGNLGNGGNCE